MKKLLSVLMVLVFILSACSKPEEPIVEPPESGEPSEDASSEPEKEFSIDDIDTSVYDEVKDYGFMYVLTKTEGTREYLLWENETVFLGEEPNEQTWLLSKNGEFLNEEPFQSGVYLFEGNPGEWWVYGIRDGVLYPFYIDENTGDFTVEEPWGPMPQEYFGYEIYEYYWSNHSPFYGVKSPDGSSFAEPVYSRIQIPFEDRIVLSKGNQQILGLWVTEILTPEKEMLSDCFNYINFNVYEDGSYFAIAFCGGNGVDGHTQTYDKEGNPMPDGWWFVDKDGNIVSDRYEYICVNEEWHYDSESKEDIIIAVTEEGEKISFPVEKILIKE